MGSVPSFKHPLPRQQLLNHFTSAWLHGLQVAAVRHATPGALDLGQDASVDHHDLVVGLGGRPGRQQPGHDRTQKLPCDPSCLRSTVDAMPPPHFNGPSPGAHSRSDTVSRRYRKSVTTTAKTPTIPKVTPLSTSRAGPSWAVDQHLNTSHT
jgi:hypothetical protein